MSPDAQGVGRSARGLPWLVLVLLAVLPYLPGLRHPFVYDDHGAIVENRFLADPAHVRDVVTLDTMTQPRVLDGQRPTLLLSMFADAAGGPLRPWRFHLTNYLLHAGCALLLFGWLRGLLRRHGAAGAAAQALGAAILFALHPLLVEAVQLPSYREDLLFLFFVLATLAAEGIAAPAMRWPVQVAGLALAAGAKESIVCVPFLLALTWWLFPAERRRPARNGILFGLTVALVVGFLTASYSGRPLQAAGGVWNGISLRWPENVWTAPWLWLRYAALLAAPWPLSADRMVAPVSPWSPQFAAGLLAVGAAAAAVWALRRRRPAVALGLGWMLVAFVPVSNLVPLYNPMADRYAYALAPGFALVVASALAAAPAPVRRAGLAGLAALYVWLVQARLHDWRSDRALWEATARTEPRSARAQAWLGVEALQAGDLAEARRRFEVAQVLNPQEVTALVNLAILDGQAGNLDAAERQLREAVRRRPDKGEAWANLAVALELQGRREEALDAAEQARRLDLLGRYGD